MPDPIDAPESAASPATAASPAPRFSVIVPAHGVAGGLSRALDSVLGQARRAAVHTGTDTDTDTGTRTRTRTRTDTGTRTGTSASSSATSDAAAATPTLEVIPVCDAPDTLDGTIAARYARQDPRVRPVCSPPDAGLSGARNTGMAAATGDYLVFLDGDDTLAPGALSAVADRLRATGDVDVLHVGHERVHWWRGAQPGNPTADAMPDAVRSPDGETFAPRHTPWLWGVSPPAWSAVHRRAFVTGHGLLFPAGAYTDIGWGGQELLAATRVAVLARVCVRHLLRRQGSRLRTPGEHHADLLDQVDRVLAHARQGTGAHPDTGTDPGTGTHPNTGTHPTPDHPLPAPCLHTLFAHLMALLLKTAAAAPTLLPHDGGRAFFERAGELYRRHRPIGFRPPPGRLGLQHRLLATGSYRAFMALRGARRRAERAAGGAATSAARVRALRNRFGRSSSSRAKPVPASALRRLGRSSSSRAKPVPASALRRLGRSSSSRAKPVPASALRHRYGAYQAALRRPVDENLAVYCAYWGRGYACNPAAVHAAARRLAPHIRSVFLVTEDGARHMPEDVEYEVLGSARAWELLARAKYLVNNANFAGAVVKRPGTVHLQTQHGTPLKKMGIEQAEYPVVAAQTGSFRKLLSRVDRWDFNLSSNQHSTEVWEREFPAGYEMLEYGYPRNDVYQTATAADVARIRRALGVPEDRTAILYAPTHRDYRATFRAQLDLAEFCATVGEEFVVLLRAHYFYGEDESAYGPYGTSRRGTEDQKPGPVSRVIDVSAHPSAEEVCLAADALVTDYSSIMFDYANLDRPIVVYADDWDVYRETRGVTFDLMAQPPGPVATTGAELARLFVDGSWAGPRSTRLRARFLERFCPYDDGRSAERVVRRVLLGEPPEALPPVIPLTARTPAPAARTPAPAPAPQPPAPPTTPES